MICQNCGAEMSPTAKFCVNCGAKVNDFPRDNLVPVNPAAPEITPDYVLKWGIIAAAFAGTGIVSFLGIIFGAIALKRANSYIALYGPISKKVKIGHILSKVGIFAGIGITLFFIIYIVFFVLVALSNTGHYYY